MDCPVDLVVINENKARVTAFFVLILASYYLVSGLWVIMAFLLIDFALRASKLGKYSLLGILSDAVIKQLKIKNKPVDRGPKRFAALVGLVFAAAILLPACLQLSLLNTCLAIVLAFFAMAESFFGFCAGCYVYSYGKKLLGK